MANWPNNVGISAIEFVFPKEYVDQVDLEKYDGVSAGKYTIGLGQTQMAFCSDREDINSLCLTALDNLVANNDIEYANIGRLDVGTETIIDKSKSIKTTLMDLFKQSENFNVEGLDTTNACYGGTAALFNAIAWMESSSWDGRLAVVIAADIAIYAKGNARPTGGVGAVAMLITPDAPLVFERGLRGTYMNNAYDFYKPDLASEYPVVDGKLSVSCYLQALDNCYKTYKEKTKDASFNLRNLDTLLFHAPYCKLVVKSFARLLLNDVVNGKADYLTAEQQGRLNEYKSVKLEDTYSDKKIEQLFIEESKCLYEKMTKNSLLLATRIGNMYTASVFSCLVSHFITTPLNELTGKRIGIFSYGSGLAASMYSIRTVDNGQLNKLFQSLQDITLKLDERIKVSPDEFNDILEAREKSLHKVPYEPSASINKLFDGTWYIVGIDDMYRRTYAKK